eukprot:190451-Chlamydomonas_euryale.AAC.3
MGEPSRPPSLLQGQRCRAVCRVAASLQHADDVHQRPQHDQLLLRVCTTAAGAGASAAAPPGAAATAATAAAPAAAAVATAAAAASAVACAAVRAAA